MQNMIIKFGKHFFWIIPFIVVGMPLLLLSAQESGTEDNSTNRERISINHNWKFYKYDSLEAADNLIYDVRPHVRKNWTWGQADDEPTEAQKIESSPQVLKPWILPAGNNFIKDKSKLHVRPEGNPGSDFPFVQSDFDDSHWEEINLPHDWAIKGPFFAGPDPEVRGGMGRLPSPGVAWYRKNLDIPESDAGKSIFLDVDGAMSYAMVWINGHLAGGWPFGYASWQVDLTPYIKPGAENQLAIRLDNPPHSSRWYPGGGIYRNVWLTKTGPVHVSQWGTYITTPQVSKSSANINLQLAIKNDSNANASITAQTQIYSLNAGGQRIKDAITSFEPLQTNVPAGKQTMVNGSVNINIQNYGDHRQHRNQICM